MPPLPTPHRPALRTIAMVVSLCFPLGVGAALPAAGQPSDGQRAPLSLSVNEADRGEVLAVVRSADVLVEAAALERAGLRNFDGRRETLDGRMFVSLASLSPGIRYELDERTLTLRLTATNTFLGNVVLDLSVARPALEYARTTSAFLNYGASWNGKAGATAALDAGFSVGPAVAQATMSWDESLGFVRTLTNVVIDDRIRLRRWTIGDSLVGAQAFGSGLLIGGFRVSREYGLDPYFVQFPTLGLSGTALTPSTVEVYVNDRLVSREQVAPGTFNLEHVPMPTGNNSTRVVVRDAFGREQQMSAPYYLTTTALARGQQDYDYAVGYPRVGSHSATWSYGGLSALARHRYGFNDRLTAGFVAEADDRTQSAGPTMNLRLPVGELALAASASRSDGATGGSAAVSYAYVGRPVNVSATLRTMTADYSTLTIGRDLDRARIEASGMIGTQISRRISLSLQEAVSSPYNRPLSSRTSLIGSVSLGRRTTAFFDVSTARENGRYETGVYGGFSITLAPLTNASVTVRNGPEGSGVSADVQRSLPIGTGIGYRARVASGGSGGGQAEGMVEAQLPFGHFEVGQDALNGQTATHAIANGGLVFIGGGVHPTRTVNDSFALVRVPTVGGVRTYLNNQETGRTDRRGNVLVPNLLPYYANRLSIADQDVPIDHSVDQVERDVAPPYRGGALVVFRAGLRQSLTGTITLLFGGQTIVPVFGDLTVSAAGRSFSSPIGRDGEFDLENVPAGRHQATVIFKNLTCQFALEVPTSASPLLRLGTLQCVVPEASER
jgi:outer membrane usher protein